MIDMRDHIAADLANGSKTDIAKLILGENDHPVTKILRVYLGFFFSLTR